MGGAGFTWYGGLLGGVIAVVVMARFRRLRFGLVANMMAPAVALGYAVARIGCLLAGDGTYGRASDRPWAMALPRGVVPTTVRVQPTALYETLAMLVVFVVLYRMARRPQPGWYVFAWFLVLSGVERFGVEFLRLNTPWILGLTPPQWFALFGILIGMTVLLAQRVHGRGRLGATAGAGDLRRPPGRRGRPRVAGPAAAAPDEVTASYPVGVRGRRWDASLRTPSM